MADLLTLPQAGVNTRTRRANKRTKFFVGGAVVLVALAFLIFNAVQTTGSYYLNVSEVKTKQAELTGRNVRVSGDIDQSSVQWNASTLDLKFAIKDQTGSNATLPVYFHGVKPDNFTRDGASAIVEGKLDANGVLQAQNLLLKCPSRYEEAPQEIKMIAQ